jgi:glutaredoxin
MLKFYLFFAFACFSLSIASASTLYKVTDKYGNVTYQETAPLGDEIFEEKTVAGEPAAEQTLLSPYDERIRIASETSPIMLFTVKECDACDFVKWFLERRNIPYENVDVEFDISNQFQLKELTGDYRVPAVLIGDRVVYGFNGEKLLEALIESAYLDESERPATQSETEVGVSSDLQSIGNVADGQDTFSEQQLLDDDDEFLPLTIANDSAENF